jgi:hypothetical protein
MIWRAETPVERIEWVTVDVPCVIGPYANVDLKLTLVKSSIRTTPVLVDGEYAREGAEDKRFSDYFGSLQSVVASSAQNDSELEINLLMSATCRSKTPV